MINLMWKNIIRRKNQSLLTIGITAITVFTFVLIFGVYVTTGQGLKASTDRLGADAIVVPPDANLSGYSLLFTSNPENKYMDAGIMDEVARLDGVSNVTPQFFSQTLSGGCCDFGREMRLVGFDPESDFVVKALINKKIYDNLGDDEIILGGEFTDFVGKKTRVLNRQFNVAGELFPTGTGMDNTIFMKIDMARQITEQSDNLDVIPTGKDSSSLISAVMVKLDDNTDPAEFANDFIFSGIDAECIAATSTVAALQDQLRNTSLIIFGLWIALLAIAVLSLVGRFNALAKDRKKEIGLMRAIGVQKKNIFGLILGEACTMALIGGIIGSIAACLLMNPVMHRIQETFMLPPSVWNPGMTAIAGVSGLLLAVLICLAAAIRPAMSAASLEPQRAITQGEVN